MLPASNSANDCRIAAKSSLDGICTLEFLLDLYDHNTLPTSSSVNNLKNYDQDWSTIEFIGTNTNWTQLVTV